MLIEINKYISNEKIEYSRIMFDKGDNPIIVTTEKTEREGE